ncbi:STAS domain-containing protein [Streptomyces sp. NPDC058622]|uniref:STAS domain-containing protein n=1 Tax=Streptomyces sp. NPDC058622 TaxID=3346562 RepID=UPI003646D2DD
MEQQVRVLPDEDGVRVIMCAGDFDQDSLQPLDRACTDAADDPGVRRIVLDVTQIDFADSSLLNLLVRMLHTGRLVVAGPVPLQLGRLLDLTQVRGVLPTADGIAAARTL